MGFLYNSLEVICMDPVRKAIDIIEKLPSQKLYAALYLLEMIASADLNSEPEDILALHSFWVNCEEEELTSGEIAQICEGEAELKAGLGVKADDVWKEL